ncbi:carbohydrate binding domain-containing protein [Hymenobacter sp. H14-R3]|uniref:carbohydrate binding domain-containing protein n=1 Tax=Hymenobacter sp. H14-R3 TaxID=3046308 RepID=UPI0024BAA443|nr:carbohydrate binding domain-containing protein [Hymenobacter sp. H14-R3]MDJ0364271.1 carbohydrate binding domain-containing protein [Hymenobacter sp. H14-R3]
MKYLAALVGLASLGACSSKDDAHDTTDTTIDDKTITFNNFEAGPGWSNDPNRNDVALVTKSRAHSGQYALKVDKDHAFSLTFEMPLGQISNSKFKTVHLDAWVYMPSAQATGTIGLQIIQPQGNESIGGGDLKFSDVVKTYGEWVKVSKDFTMPDNITAANRLRLFMWRAGASDEVFLDDVKLSIKD